MHAQITASKFFIVANLVFLFSLLIIQPVNVHAQSVDPAVWAPLPGQTTTFNKIRDPLLFKASPTSYILGGTPPGIVEYPSNKPEDLIPSKGKSYLTQIYSPDGKVKLRSRGFTEWEKVFYQTPTGLKMTASLPPVADFNTMLASTSVGTRKTYIFIPSTSSKARKTDSGFPLDWQLETNNVVLNSYTALPYTDTDGKQYAYSTIARNVGTFTAGCLGVQTMDSSFHYGPVSILMCPGLAVSTTVDATGWDRRHPLPQEIRTAEGGGLIENPLMYHSPDGKYYAVYSSGDYADPQWYGGAMAVCDTPVGPCTKVLNSSKNDLREFITGSSTNYQAVGRPFPIIGDNGKLTDLIFHANSIATGQELILRCLNAVNNPTFLEDFAHGGPSCDYDGSMQTLPSNPTPLTTASTTYMTSLVRQLGKTLTGGAPVVATITDKAGVKSELMIRTNQTVDGVLSLDGKTRSYAIEALSGDASGLTWTSLAKVLTHSVSANKRLDIGGLSIYQATDSTIYVAYHEQVGLQNSNNQIVWSSYSLKLVKSNDFGKTWTEAPATVTTTGISNSDPFIIKVSKRPTALQMYFTHERQVDTTCSTDKNLKPASDIYLRESFDNGATWQYPRIAVSRGVSREAKPTIVELFDGSLLMAFETARNSSCEAPDQTTEIGLATSNNGGLNWTYLPNAFTQAGNFTNTNPSLTLTLGKQLLLKFASNETRLNDPTYRYPWTDLGSSDARVLVSTNIPTAFSAPVWSQSPVVAMTSAREGKLTLMANGGIILTGNDVGFDRTYYRTFPVKAFNGSLTVEKPTVTEVIARITNAVTATSSYGKTINKQPTKLLLADGTVVNAGDWFPLTKNGAFISDNIDIKSIPGASTFEGLTVDRLGAGVMRVAQSGKLNVKGYYTYTDAQLEVQNAQFAPASLFGIETDSASGTVRAGENLSRFDYYSLSSSTKVSFGFYSTTGWDQINSRVVPASPVLAATIITNQSSTNLQSKLVQLLQLLQSLLSLQKR